MPCAGPLNLPDRAAALLDAVTVGFGVGTKVFRPDTPSLSERPLYRWRHKLRKRLSTPPAPSGGLTDAARRVQVLWLQRNLGSPEFRTWGAITTDGVGKSGNQLRGQRLITRRAGGGPITATRWTFLKDELCAVERFSVDPTVEDKAASGVVTNHEALHLGSLLEGGTVILPWYETVNTVDIPTYPVQLLASLDRKPCRTEEHLGLLALGAIRKSVSGMNIRPRRSADHSLAQYCVKWRSVKSKKPPVARANPIVKLDAKNRK